MIFLCVYIVGADYKMENTSGFINTTPSIRNVKKKIKNKPP